MNYYDLQIYKGASYLLSVTLTDINNTVIDLSSLNVSSYIRSNYGSTGVIANLNPQIINSTSGIITLSLGYSQTTGLPIGISFYDIKLSTGDTSILALAGKVYISPTIS